MSVHELRVVWAQLRAARTKLEGAQRRLQTIPQLKKGEVVIGVMIRLLGGIMDDMETLMDSYMTGE